MKTTLVIGANGYLGRAIVDHLRGVGEKVVTSSSSPRRGIDVVTATRAELQTTLDTADFTRVITCVQLGRECSSWVAGLVDGPRWIVMSSAQLNNTVPNPLDVAARNNESLAVGHGALVVRPTMIYGHGNDGNVSVLARRLLKIGVAPLVDRGNVLLQPIHVDDVVDAVTRPTQRSSGVFCVGGSEPTSARELIGDIAELLGRKFRAIPVSAATLRVAAYCAPLAGLRPDQILRLLEDKTVDNVPFTQCTGWMPQPHAVRLEQAMSELTNSASPDRLFAASPCERVAA